MKILTFGAVWCPGCLIMRPIFKQIKNEIEDLNIENYDYDMNEDAIIKWEIGRKLPVFIFLDQNEQEIIRLIGEQKKEKLIALIDEYKNR